MSVYFDWFDWFQHACLKLLVGTALQAFCLDPQHCPHNLHDFWMTMFEEKWREQCALGVREQRLNKPRGPAWTCILPLCKCCKSSPVKGCSMFGNWPFRILIKVHIWTNDTWRIGGQGHEQNYSTPCFRSNHSDIYKNSPCMSKVELVLQPSLWQQHWLAS